MYKLLIFAITMLLLSSICNGQGKSTFGATRAQDTSMTVAQVKFSAYGGSLDTMLMTILPNGDVKKVAKSAFSGSAGFGLVKVGNTLHVDTSIFFKQGGNDFGISTGIIGSTTGSLDIISYNDSKITLGNGDVTTFNLNEFRINDGSLTHVDALQADSTVRLTNYPNAGILGTDANGELIDNSGNYMELVDPFDFLDEAANDTGLAVQYAINYLQGVEEVSFVAGNVVLDSVAPARSGRIRFRPIVHTISRDLVKNVTHPTLGTRYVNSQLYIPLISEMLSGRKANQIVFQGDAPPSFFVNYLNAAPIPLVTNEPVLHSTINNDGSVYPALLRSVPGDTLSPFGMPISINTTEFYLDNITLRVHHDTALGGTQLCGVDFYNATNQAANNFRIDCDFDNYYTVAPSFNVFGIRSGVSGTGNNMTFTNGVITGGFKYAAVGYEHSKWNNVVTLVNYYAFESAISNYATELDNYGSFGNRYLIHAGDFEQSALPAQNTISGSIRAESNIQGKWYDRDTDFDVKDSLSLIRGNLAYWITVNGSPVDTIRVSGGNNLTLKYENSTTSGTTIFKYPNNLRTTLGDGLYSIFFNNAGGTPASQSELYLDGDALGMNLHMKNQESTGFVNILMDNDRASSTTQALIQLGGSAEVQGPLFGRQRRDVLMIATNGTNNRGMAIGPLTSDTMALGTASTTYGWLLPAGNWEFSPTSTFNIYRQSPTTYNVGIGTKEPLRFLSQTMTDRRVINLTDSTFFAGYYASGSTGAAMTLGHMNATSGQRYFQMFNSAGIVSQFAISDNGGAVNFYLQRANMANGGTHFGGTAAITPSAWVQAAAGTTTMPPIKWTSGTNLTTPQAGASEFNGTSLFFTPSATRLRFVLTDNTIPSNGQIPIGNGTNYTNATLSGGTGINITNGSGTVTVATTGDVTVTTTAAGTLSPSASGDYVFTGTTSTWTLPLVTGTSGRKMFIKNRGSGTVTINANAGLNEIYSNAAVNTYALTAGSAIILVSDGVMWNVE